VNLSFSYSLSSSKIFFIWKKLFFCSGFQISPKGEVRTTDGLPRDPPARFVAIVISDHGSASLSTTVTLTVNVLCPVAGSPIFDQQYYCAGIKENSLANTEITRVTVSLHFLSRKYRKAERIFCFLGGTDFLKVANFFQFLSRFRLVIPITGRMSATFFDPEIPSSFRLTIRVVLSDHEYHWTRKL
jgi:hypothetical protein